MKKARPKPIDARRARYLEKYVADTRKMLYAMLAQYDSESHYCEVSHEEVTRMYDRATKLLS
jgi:hypothetical protein